MMRLVLLTALTMVAFAANSVLTRLALADGSIGAMEFAGLRTVSGAVMLALLVALSRGTGMVDTLKPTASRLISVVALTFYMIGFSMAYIVLDAGAGALILFGGVQVTMFAGALMGGERVPAPRWIGAALALAGLAIIMWPSGRGAPPMFWSGMMALAALGWGVYSLKGRGERRPLQATAANFLWATPPVLLATYLIAAPYWHLSLRGVILAITAGALTSGVGYAMWFRALPQLRASVAALTQLSVPIIAMAGGMVFLAEPLSTRFVFAAALVMGGIAYGILAPQRTITSSGS